MNLPLRELPISRSGTGQPKVGNFGALPAWNEPSITFLIHGYDTDHMGAAANHERLLRTMEGLSILPEELRSRSWLIYWEGFASLGLAPGKPLLSKLTYPIQITSAQDAALALKEFIDANLAPRTIVNIIAHPLGCRVTLELLEMFVSSSPQRQFGAVVLMAPAVPVYFVEKTWFRLGRGRIRADEGRLLRGAKLPHRKYVLFSHRDMVLRLAFPVGQTVANEGFFPKAIGTAGGPRNVWSKEVSTKNGHSGYFRDRIAASEIAEAFGRIERKTLPVHNVADAITALPDRKLPISLLAIRELPALPARRAA